MIQLTPLEETAAVKELLQIKEKEAILIGKQKGRKEGRKEGIEAGELICKIIMAQGRLKQTFIHREFLLEQSIEQLKTILAKLEAKIQ